MMQKMKTPKIGLMKCLLIFPVTFALMFLSTAAITAPAVEQTDEVVEVVATQNDDIVFEVVEQRPEFPGGHAAMMQWLGENIQYPAEAIAQGVQGTVLVQYIVERDGSISDVRVVRAVNPYLDAEAVRAVQAMPEWQPGRQDGETVRVRFTLPVQFRLQENAPTTPTETAPAPVAPRDPDYVFGVGTVEQRPEFQGGQAAMMRWLGANMRYPREALNRRIQGTVVTQFIIERDGRITNVAVSRNIDPLLDAEAIRVVQAMPNWQPGKQDGETVRVKFTLPLVFRIQ